MAWAISTMGSNANALMSRLRISGVAMFRSAFVKVCAEGRVVSTVLPWTPPSAFSFLFHRADGEARDEPVDEKIVDDRNRQTRDQTRSHHGTPEIDVAAHQEGRHADAYGVAS